MYFQQSRLKSKPSSTAPAVVTEVRPVDGGDQIQEEEAQHFLPGDRRNPYNWSLRKKAYCAATMCLAMANSTLSSSMPGGTLPYIAAYFGVAQQSTKAALPSTVFLLGYVVGPLLFSPLSEQHGRRPVMLGSFGLFLACSLGCALAPTFGALVALRLFAGMGGSASISVIGGVYADVFETGKARGQATAMYTVLTTVGTVAGPVIYGYMSSFYGWRWAFGLSTILAGVTFALILFLPETYAPVILLRSSSPSSSTSVGSCTAAGNPTSAPSPPNTALLVVITTALRPLRMFFTEAIVFFSSLYISFVFAVLFLFFQCYGIIFRDLYGMSTSTATLAFLPMVPGTLLSWPLTLLYDRYYYRRRERLRAASTRRGPSSTEVHQAVHDDDDDDEDLDDYRRLPLACVCGPVLAISLFWLAWTAVPGRIHWIVPMLSGLPFSVALVLIISTFFNYLTDSYVSFAASALAAASCARSLWGALLPLVAAPMYDALGVGWGTSILGVVAVALVPVPFVFIRFGSAIRSKSRFCRAIAEEKKKKKNNNNSRNTTMVGARGGRGGSNGPSQENV